MAAKQGGDVSLLSALYPFCVSPSINTACLFAKPVTGNLRKSAKGSAVRRLRLPCVLFFLRLALHGGAAQTEVVGCTGGVAAQHGLHDADVAVHVHGVGAVQLIQLVLEARHDIVHGGRNTALGLGQILAADPRLLKVGVVLQQLQRGGQVVVQERTGGILFAGIVLDGLEDAARHLLDPVES